jgi:hypothetical protein
VNGEVKKISVRSLILPPSSSGTHVGSARNRELDRDGLHSVLNLAGSREPPPTS